MKAADFSMVPCRPRCHYAIHDASSHDLSQLNLQHGGSMSAIVEAK